MDGQLSALFTPPKNELAESRGRVYLDAIAGLRGRLAARMRLGGGWRDLPISGRRMRDGRRERQREKPEPPDAAVESEQAAQPGLSPTPRNMGMGAGSTRKE